MSHVTGGELASSLSCECSIFIYLFDCALFSCEPHFNQLYLKFLASQAFAITTFHPTAASNCCSMGELLASTMGEVSLDHAPGYEPTPFGKEMLKHFLFDPTYKNMNHGTFAHHHPMLHSKTFRVIWNFPSSFARETTRISRSLRISTRPFHPLCLPKTFRSEQRSCCKNHELSSIYSSFCIKCNNRIQCRSP